MRRAIFMPYKDPEKRKAANRQSMAKARAAAKTEKQEKKEMLPLPM